jgi:hypothetical protein
MSELLAVAYDDEETVGPRHARRQLRSDRAATRPHR